MHLAFERKSRVDHQYSSCDHTCTYAQPGAQIVNSFSNPLRQNKSNPFHSQMRNKGSVRLPYELKITQQMTLGMSDSSVFPTEPQKTESKKIMKSNFHEEEKFVFYFLCPLFIDLFIYSTNWHIHGLLHATYYLFWEARHGQKQHTKKLLQFQVLVLFASHVHEAEIIAKVR